jgi:transcriptional regulator with XRE-family HTH domain
MDPGTRDRIRQIMEERGLNALTLAEAAGLGQSSVYAILQGRVTSTRMVTLEKIASLLRRAASGAGGFAHDEKHQQQGSCQQHGEGGTRAAHPNHGDRGGPHQPASRPQPTRGCENEPYRTVGEGDRERHEGCQEEQRHYQTNDLTNDLHDVSTLHFSTP